MNTNDNDFPIFAANDHLDTLMNDYYELRDLAGNFACIGNDYMCDKLLRIANNVFAAQKGITQAIGAQSVADLHRAQKNTADTMLALLKSAAAKEAIK